VAVVVSLGKLAAGHEDYYAMRGEAAGEWTGSGAQALGLDGSASGGQLRALLEGRDPVSLRRMGSEGVAGRSSRSPHAQKRAASPMSVRATDAVSARLTHSSLAWAPSPPGPNRTVGMPAEAMNAESAQ
jgi:hypothetical protein